MPYQVIRKCGKIAYNFTDGIGTAAVRIRIAGRPSRMVSWCIAPSLGAGRSAYRQRRPKLEFRAEFNWHSPHGKADCHRHIRPRTLPVTHGQDGNDRSVENTNIFSKLSSADVGSASALGAQAGLCSSCRSATSIKPSHLTVVCRYGDGDTVTGDQSLGGTVRRYATIAFRSS